MDASLFMWIVFWVVVAVALFVDLVILQRHQGNVGFKEAVKMVCLWIGLALSFGVFIYFASGDLGSVKALEYITGYVVEYSLSIDNMFVFLMIFAYFAIPKQHQPKVLIYGIIGAIVLRFLFVFIGIQLINAFAWIIYVFGAVLIVTAVKMFFQKDEQVNPEKNIAYRILKKFFSFTTDIKTSKFFIKEKGVLYATPMLAAVGVIEVSDIIFAVDSIPAVLSISRDTFIVYTSNIFAIVGLRSLYFLLSNLAEKFKYLQYGVAVILFFVGLKMIIQHHIPVPTHVSLAIIILILGVSIITSIVHDKKKAK
ncbi:TerC family protein [Endomicrobium proavitum]|uniref:Integral membrane protein TerC n=1 Tax=Endomicrobium proavitum TaxID=1408281 RepID=A0A0G3WLH1_9BACT|nr:TerC family protein [Endomicrobium proavitum]AKL98712.1 Integral membrane protein TerC [Endomicrobium proavitum]